MASQAPGAHGQITAVKIGVTIATVFPTSELRMRHNKALRAVLAALLFAAGSTTAPAADTMASKEQIARGRYLLIVGNCNDCHTAGFAPSDGKVPESGWLLGDGKLGFRGPWGTTYAANLRLSLSRMKEDDWVHFARNLRTRPPMPWFSLNQWTEADLRAFYRYVRQLGPAGAPIRAALPPEKEPTPPYVLWPAPPAKKK
jgi:mono/diheme cytochrome c family protein